MKLHIIYNLDYTFSDLHDTGTIEVVIDHVAFSVMSINEIDTENVTGWIKYYTTSGDYQIGVRAYPYHHHMQVIASQVMDFFCFT